MTTLIRFLFAISISDVYYAEPVIPELEHAGTNSLAALAVAVFGL